MEKGNEGNKGGEKKEKNVENRRTDRVSRFDTMVLARIFEPRRLFATKTTAHNETTIQISIVYAGQPRIFFFYRNAPRRPVGAETID